MKSEELSSDAGLEYLFSGDSMNTDVRPFSETAVIQLILLR